MKHKNHTLFRTVGATVLAGLLGMLAGCNTVKGMGQDLQKAGQKIEDVAKKP
jgi:predicted small secreted protein